MTGQYVSMPRKNSSSEAAEARLKRGRVLEAVVLVVLLVVVVVVEEAADGLEAEQEDSERLPVDQGRRDGMLEEAGNKLSR